MFCCAVGGADCVLGGALNCGCVTAGGRPLLKGFWLIGRPLYGHAPKCFAETCKTSDVTKPGAKCVSDPTVDLSQNLLFAIIKARNFPYYTHIDF